MFSRIPFTAPSTESRIPLTSVPIPSFSTSRMESTAAMICPMMPPFENVSARVLPTVPITPPMFFVASPSLPSPWATPAREPDFRLWSPSASPVRDETAFVLDVRRSCAALSFASVRVATLAEAASKASCAVATSSSASFMAEGSPLSAAFFCFSCATTKASAAAFSLSLASVSSRSVVW